ncbi:hypothetical protein Tco_0952727 [Tanacetum coccineum]|uniref:Uncharacterized protein n=1 Tax=Tanacetum coccineum TaxID=301880 RepID=A0ABQ5E062_9ASTR
MSAKHIIRSQTCVLTKEELSDFHSVYLVHPEYKVMLPKRNETIFDAPDGLNPFVCAKLITFAVMCKAYGYEPTIELFRGFFNLFPGGNPNGQLVAVPAVLDISRGCLAYQEAAIRLTLLFLSFSGEGFDLNEEEVVPKVDDVSLVDGVFDGAFVRDGEEDIVMGEGVVVTYSSLERLTKSCLGGMIVSLILLEGLEEEA